MENLSKTQLMRLIVKQQEKISGMRVAPEANEIAIIGMSCRLPGGSNDTERFWEVLEKGIDAVSDDTSARWSAQDYLGPLDAHDKAYTMSAGLIDDIDQFDPSFFNISPREAQSMDPQQRLALEMSWRALESAGIAPDALAGSKTGVFMGVGDNEYMQRCYSTGASENFGHVVSSNATNVISGRIAYTMDLQGPCMAIDTACSSSLVAVHLACQSLRSGESQLAIAGGVNVLLAGDTFVVLSKANMLSPTGRCKTFSDAADGYVRAEGCAVVILKRLADARRDGDRVLAVIKGSAVNHDGRSSSLTAPNGAAQVAVIRAALDAANVDPQQVSYVETHGTGTGLGDPIEVQSLDAVYGPSHSAAMPLYLGALKSNIGHAESASGIAALIKTVLCLQKKQIPANLHCDLVNPRIAADFTRLHLPSTLGAWPAGAPALAGVSSFGFSGTNAHMIVGAAEQDAALPVTPAGQLLPVLVSARSKEALAQLLDEHYRYLGAHAVPLEQFAKACALGRSTFEYRAGFCASSRDDAMRQLHELSTSALSDSLPMGKLAFLFSGQGSQYPEMGRRLYDSDPLFRQCLDRCCALLDAHLEQPLMSVMWDPQRASLDQTEFTQPALFALEYALASFWLSVGVEPDYVMGHSVGEFAAACIAGVFSLEDACKLICARGRLMAKLGEPGAMLAVLAPVETISSLLATYADVSVAALNGPSSHVISGGAASIGALERGLLERGIGCQLLKVSHAFHSPLMAPMLAEFMAIAEQVCYAEPVYGFISNVTGKAESALIANAAYWREHVMATVDFHGGMKTLEAAGVSAYLEIGPSATLLGMGRRCASHDDALWLPSMRQGQCWEALLPALVQLYTRGWKIRWAQLFDQAIPMAAIPGHPLQNSRFWLDAGTRAGSPVRARVASEPLLGTALPLPNEHDHLFMAQWVIDSPAYLDHHRLYQQVVVPAASHVSMMLAAAEKAVPSVAYELRDLVFPEALTLGDTEEAMVQLYLKHGAGRAYTLQLKRISDLATGHRLHAEGKLEALDAAPSASGQELAQWRAHQQRHDRHFSGASFYQDFWKLGYTLGTAFRWIEEGWQNDMTVLVRMAVPALPDGANDYGFYPGLIDSCFQLVACCANGEKTSLDSGKIYIPFTVERISYAGLGDNTQPLWCVATLREKPTEQSARVIGDIVLFTEQGRVVARISGFQARVTNEAGLFQMLAKKGAAGAPAYVTEWRRAQPEAAPRRAAERAAPWLVVGSPALAADLANGAQSALHIDPRQVGLSCQDALSVKAAWRDCLKRLGDPVALAGVVFEARYAGAELARELLLVSALSGALDDDGRDVGHGLVYLNRDGAALSADTQLDPHAAAMAALLAVLRSEGAAMTLRSLCIDGGQSAASLPEALELALSCRGEQLALRADLCYAPVLLPAPPRVGAPLAQGWYVVSGAFHGLGLEIARHLAGSAAKGLILLGRSEPSPALIEFAAQWAGQGVPVRLERIDVCDGVALAAWAARLHADGVAVTGVVHAAGVLHDQMAGQLDLASIERVLAPKVAGTKHLLDVLADHPLKHFICFSSMSALLGTSGQAAYAVANAHMDATMHQLRAARGIGMSIAWGPWSEVGMAARLDASVQRHYQSRGIDAFDLARGIAAFAAVAAWPLAQVGVIEVDWNVYGKGQKTPFLLSELCSVATPPAGLVELDLTGLTQQQRQARVREATTVLLKRALNYQGALSSDSAELASLGVDSLIAVDLRNKLQKSFGANVAIADMMSGMTLAGLVRAVDASLGELASDDEEVALVIRERDRHQPFPITDMQQAYWIGRTGIFELGGMSLHGYQEIESATFDLPRFGEAWRRLVARHDMLRAYILPSGEQIVVQHPAPYQIAERDLRGLPADDVERALAEIRADMSHQVLPLDRAPAFDLRASLLDEGRIRLHISVDGTYLDFRSFLILFRELILLYKDLDCTLQPLEMTFRDYVLTLLAQDGTKAFQRSLAYWSERIKTIAGAPELPLAKHPAQVRNHRSKRWESGLSVVRWEKFRASMQQHGLTQAAVLLAVYAEVLATWSTSSRFCINVPVFNRQGWHADVNHVLGNFSSFVLVECDYTREMSFADRVREIQRQMMEGLQHHHISGVQILRMINQARGKISAGAYPCVYTSLPSGVDDWDSSLKSMLTRELGEIKYTISQTPQVWIDVHVWYESGGLDFNWDAVEELFPVGMIDAMFGAYCTMVEALADEPSYWERSRIDLVPPAQARLLDDVNRTAREIGTELLQEKFYAAADAFPDHPAVIDCAGEVSYRGLRASANRIAHYLRSQGAARNELVAVAMGKGSEQIAAVMGILIAGAAYLPVDLAQPQSRIDYLLKDGQVRFVLTDAGSAGARQWPEGVRADSVASIALRESRADDLAPLQSQTDLAYVLYTSGSTGKPKGVMITHRNVVNMIEHTNGHFGIGQHDRAFNITALNHDLSVYDIFGCLSAGAAIVMPDEDKRREPAHWLALMQAHRVTLWNSVPALMDMLLESIGTPADGAAPVLPSLRVVILGGDWVAPALPGRIKPVAPNASLLSIGGPTETTVWNIWQCMDDVNSESASIPYGKPISNSQYFILGPSDKPCPFWVIGELCCAGEGLAQGYLNDADNTARSFVAHPLSGVRMYRTGDMGRYLPDGTIEFMGRKDFQMKIRGQRIEAGEIEHVLLSLDGVDNAAVVDVGSGLQKTLVAHVAIAGSTKNMGQANKTADFLSEDEQAGMLTSPIDRLQFTLAGHGLRRFGEPLERRLLERGEAGPERTQCYLRRQSFRQFDGVLKLAQLEKLLACLSIETLDGQVLPKYRYPSAGGLYPVQTYLYIKPDAVAGLAGGYYYHDPAASALVQLSGPSDVNAGLYAGYLRPLADASAFSLFLVADMAAIEPMYGKVARDFCLIEAGYMGQLLMSEGVGELLGLCPVGGLVADSQFRQLLQLADSHTVVHSFTGGAIALEQTRYWLEKPNSGGDGDPVALTPEQRMQEHLRQYVPEYMVPTRFVLHERLPLTENGKIDRKLLRESASVPASGGLTDDFAAPDTPLEQRFADILCRILNLAQVNVEGNFFEMGANSIHMVKIQKGIAEVTGRELAVTDLFRYPTLRSLITNLFSADEAKPAVSASRERAAKRAAVRPRARSRQLTDIEEM